MRCYLFIVKPIFCNYICYIIQIMLFFEKMNMEGSLVILVVVVPLLTALIFIIRYYNYKNLLGFETLHLAMHSTRSSDETKPADVIQQSTNTGVSGATAPLSVNFHLTRQCNYRCGFCFHTAITSFVLPVAEAMRGLSLLADSGELASICFHIHVEQPRLRGY